MAAKEIIESGKVVLGIEFGSTRIKGVLIDADGAVLAIGTHDWENRLTDGIWTYTMEDITSGLQDCYASLTKEVEKQYGARITSLAAIGISAMMHGYMAFDEKDELMVPFRTWRNTITEKSADELTELFGFNIPQRWSIAHLYQAILNGEEHVGRIRYVSTLAGFIHWKLTGRKVLGIGDASGMFPIDSTINDYDPKMVQLFNEKIAEKGYPWKFPDIFPKVLCAGEDAGVLTEEGAKFLDISGNLKAGIPLCPPEGDAGTGMVATNSVAVRTGNVSAGTSIFAMIVLEKALSKLHREIDMVTTPAGAPCAMAHANNCTSDLNAWVDLFREFAQAYGIPDIDMNKLYGTLYNKALEGDKDCGGNMAYGFYSGENILPLDEGRPLFVRMPDAKFNLANFMRTNLYTAFGAMKIGCDILIREEHVQVDRITGHGGLFKTKGVAQGILAAALNAPVTVMATAGEGGAWGIAVLADYEANKAAGEKLDEFLDQKIFAGQQGSTMDPDPADVEGFEKFIEFYKAGVPVEQAAVKNLRN
ncbi:MAG: FGGY-family carbohydrate kinase [Lachnospiraceae bacterium]|jgi:sugar (pentulose or hexulose) kinase|nr:FGGY-family carbohydrate kinase [Lachnospiraceae bacterium]